jgi:hypothetical protein
LCFIFSVFFHLLFFFFFLYFCEVCNFGHFIILFFILKKKYFYNKCFMNCLIRLNTVENEVSAMVPQSIYNEMKLSFIHYYCF